jgi:hypothetical protein
MKEYLRFRHISYFRRNPTTPAEPDRPFTCCALIGRLPMTKVGRAVEKGETQGFMKIIVDEQTHEILGAAILGTGGDEAIHSILDVMYSRAAIHRYSASCAHSPDRLRADPDDAWRTPTARRDKRRARSVEC